MEAVQQNSIGMQFRSPAERDRFFEQARANPASVPFGAAIAHAASVHLGIWGNDKGLRADCAEIMAAEVTRFAAERGLQLVEPVTAQQVAATSAFCHLFAAARIGPDSQLQSLVNSLGIEGEVGRYESHRPPPKSDLTPGNAHVVIFDELVQMRALAM